MALDTDVVISGFEHERASTMLRKVRKNSLGGGFWGSLGAQGARSGTMSKKGAPGVSINGVFVETRWDHFGIFVWSHVSERFLASFWDRFWSLFGPSLGPSFAPKR